MHETVITRHGMRRLRAELEQLTTSGRRSVAERLREAAASEANHAENSEYFAASADQALLERRIARLEERLGAARLVEPSPGNGRIDVGERLCVRDLTSGEQLDLELVGPLEVEPSAGRISVASPLGKALVGLRRGDVADVETPRGQRQFEVLAVEPPAPAAV
jgi:transcription elongation factor GreA